MGGNVRVVSRLSIAAGGHDIGIASLPAAGGSGSSAREIYLISRYNVTGPDAVEHKNPMLHLGFERHSLNRGDTFVPAGAWKHDATMVLIYPRDPALCALTHASAKSGHLIRTAADRPHLEVLAGRAELLILKLDLREYGTAQIRRFQAMNPLVPLLLVTSGARENVRLLKDVIVEDVVWCEEAQKQLGPHLESVLAQDPVNRLADLLERGTFFELRLRGVLALALRRSPPFGNLKAWVASTAWKDSWLYEHWPPPLRTAIGTPAEFLDFVLLLRAGQLRLRRTNWQHVAAELVTTTKRLRRIGKENGYQSLNDLVDELDTAVLRLRHALVPSPGRGEFDQSRQAEWV
ncbi:MAG: hypothetical protein ACRELD_05840 [Longimicrobiales bacterium]